MGYNLFIAYDLVTPGQDYPELREAIERLGGYSWLQYSLAYVKTDMVPARVHAHLRGFMDPNDRLAVIVAADAFVSSYPEEAMTVLRRVFNAPQLAAPRPAVQRAIQHRR